MKKAYSVVNSISKQAVSLLEEADIRLTIRNSGESLDAEELRSILQEHDILIIGIKTHIQKEILNFVKTPKIIATLSIGLDHIDSEVIDSKLIKVINIKNANTISVAEHILSLILALNKRIFESNNLVIQQKGNRKNLHERPEDISGKTLGLIGAGNITREVVKISKIFNMNMLCFTKHPEHHKELIAEGVIFKSLDEVLAESDIISINIPLTNETKNLISRDKIKLLKSNATFINTSRTNIVDMEALLEKADKNNTFYVGLDIDVDEHCQLLSKYRNNVIITPHIAGCSKQATDRTYLEVATKIKECLNNDAHFIK